MPINDSKYWNEALETISRQDLEKQQLIDLKKIVKYAYENSPYYKRAFDKAGVKPEDIVTLKDIEKFPFMDKKTQRDTQGKGSFLGELCAVPENDVVFISHCIIVEPSKFMVIKTFFFLVLNTNQFTRNNLRWIKPFCYVYCDALVLRHCTIVVIKQFNKVSIIADLFFLNEFCHKIKRSNLLTLTVLPDLPESV